MWRCLWTRRGTSSLLLQVLTLSLCEGNGQDKRPRREMVSNSLEESVVTTYWWGEWTKWTGCTRSCGVGVMSQERHCLKQRKRSVAGKESMLCRGSGRKYRLCNVKDCPPSGRSFREEQCWSFNSQLYNGRHYRWKPLYPSDDIHISSNPCDLHCTTLDGQRQLMVMARDGTSCKYTNHRGVCVGGRCEPIGCDGTLFSSYTLDKCGICQGNGSRCRRITGNFRRGPSSLGYDFVTEIPRGAWDIQVVERKKSADVLALSDKAGNFFFNGAYRPDNPQNFQVAGTVFKYRRPTDVHETGIEYMVAKGPLNQPVNVLLWKQNGQTPHITYEYTVWRSPQAEGRLSLNNSELDENLVVGEEPKAETTGVRTVQVTNEVYEDKTEQTISHITGRNNSRSTSTRRQEVPVARETHEKRADPENLIISGNRETGDLNINISTNRLLMGSSHVSPKEWSMEKVEDLPVPLSESLQQHIMDLQHNNTDDLLLFNHTVTPGFRSSNWSEHTRKSLPKNSRPSPADMYRWKLSSKEPCSMTCSTGVSRAMVACMRYDGAVVDDKYCNNETRPEPLHDLCIGRECEPRWEASSWSECSRTCGEGVQYRAVRCWKMLSPGLDSSVYSDICLGAELERPSQYRNCSNPTCGPQWEVAQWPQCPAKCGHRTEVSRDVRCSEEEASCDQTVRPPSVKNCSSPPCERQWAASEWGPCSGSCGKGTMVRHVFCKTPEGRMVPESQCPADTRPLAINPCGGADCPPHWLVQDWEMCNATCGRGTQSRVVLCAGVVGGKTHVYGEDRCASEKHPANESTCFERPCFQWYTTPWSECTRTCGVGTRARDVKCYQGREIVKGCDPWTKPDSKQACPLDPCPTQPPDENCKDQANTNCTLALKVNLCSHWYYSKACCHSCRFTGVS